MHSLSLVKHRHFICVAVIETFISLRILFLNTITFRARQEQVMDTIIVSSPSSFPQNVIK